MTSSPLNRTNCRRHLERLGVEVDVTRSWPRAPHFAATQSRLRRSGREPEDSASPRRQRAAGLSGALIEMLSLGVLHVPGRFTAAAGRFERALQEGFAKHGHLPVDLSGVPADGAVLRRLRRRMPVAGLTPEDSRRVTFSQSVRWQSRRREYGTWNLRIHIQSLSLIDVRPTMAAP